MVRLNLRFRRMFRRADAISITTFIFNPKYNPLILIHRPSTSLIYRSSIFTTLNFFTLNHSFSFDDVLLLKLISKFKLKLQIYKCTIVKW